MTSAATWQEWRERARPVDVDGLSVAGYDLGPTDGTPFTFLHGYPSSSLDVDPTWQLLGDGWRLVALDFPGFGASDKPVGHRYSIHAAADAVEAQWAATGVDETMLVAHDYGVSVAQELLARRLDGVLDTAVESVIWMNGGLYPDLHRPTVGQQLLIDEGGADLAASLTEELFVSGIRVTWGTRRAMDEREIAEIWASMAERGGVARMHDLLHYVEDRRRHERRWRDALELSELPMTFVWGDLDPVSGAHMIERVEERVPAAAVVRLDDVGHWPLLEAPDVLAAAMRAART
jgi:pimeloyl-ACP methyl ester carboxylesterase